MDLTNFGSRIFKIYCNSKETLAITNMNFISDKNVLSYQFPKRVIFADGYICLKAAGMLPEKAGRTEREEKENHGPQIISSTRDF